MKNGQIASCSRDGSVKIWDPKSGKNIRTIKAHTEFVYTITQLRDGSLASGSADNLIKLWDPKKGELITTLVGHHFPVRAL